MGKEKLFEVFAGNRTADQILVESLQAGDEILEVVGSDLIQNLFIALLGNNTLRWIAIAASEAEQLFKGLFQIKISAPAESLCKREGDSISVIDLSEHEAVRRIDDMTADHAGETVQRQHGAFAGAASGDNIVTGAGVEQNGSKNAVLNVGELCLVFCSIHAVVVNGMSHGFNHFFKGFFDDCIFCSLAVFIDKCNAHNEDLFLIFALLTLPRLNVNVKHLSEHFLFFMKVRSREGV